MVRVLYDHADATVDRLLAAIAHSLPPGGRLVVSEPMSGGARPDPVTDGYLAIYTLAMETGRTRTAADIAGRMTAVVQVRHSGVSTGTEKLFWQGTMPPFPGMGYPPVPGYESFGEVVEAGAASGFLTGEAVFVPGGNCYEGGLRGLFGGAAHTLVTPAARVSRLDAATGPQGALLALAATARHAIAGFNTRLPELIVGHGTLGRLLARLTVAAGGPAPTVWEVNPARRDNANGYECIDPAADPKGDYRTIYDASGAKDRLNQLVMRLAGGVRSFWPGSTPTPCRSLSHPPS